MIQFWYIYFKCNISANEIQTLIAIKAFRCSLTKATSFEPLQGETVKSVLDPLGLQDSIPIAKSQQVE